eukprot:c35195_g1_i1 orf=3-215(-)
MQYAMNFATCFHCMKYFKQYIEVLNAVLFQMAVGVQSLHIDVKQDNRRITKKIRSVKFFTRSIEEVWLSML